MLDDNQKLIDPFFTRRRHKDLDVFHSSQSYFDLHKRTIRIKSNLIIKIFQQTIKDVEPLYRDIAGFDMSFDEWETLCRDAWRVKYNYLILNKLKDDGKSKYVICNESNPECIVFILNQRLELFCSAFL